MRSRRMPSAAVTVVAGVLLLAGCGAGSPGAAAGSPDALAAPTPTASSPAPAPAPDVDVPITAATAPAVQPDVPPVQVRAAAIDVELPVVPVGVEAGGFMELNPDPDIGGWYRFGSDPADPAGNTVISAHVDAPGYGIGPLSRLRELTAGARIEVTDAAGTTRAYAVESVTYYPKQDLPVAELFSRDGSPKLVLITCGGEFDADWGHYTDNVVAVATPTA